MCATLRKSRSPFASFFPSSSFFSFHSNSRVFFLPEKILSGLTIPSVTSCRFVRLSRIIDDRQRTDWEGESWNIDEKEEFLKLGCFAIDISSRLRFLLVFYAHNRV